MKQQSKKQTEDGMVVALVITFMFTLIVSNAVKSPRSSHGSPNRGGLANHVLQGSLRLTASRHHILANSGMEIDLNKRRELNRGLSHNIHSQDDEVLSTFDDDNLLLKNLVSSRRARRPTEKGVNMVNRKRGAASDAQSETASQKRQKGILKSTEKKILKRAKKIRMKKNKRTRSNNRRTKLLTEDKQETVKEAETVQSPISLKSPVSIKSPTSSEDGTSRHLRTRPPKNVSVEPEPQPAPADNYLETVAVPSGASETELTARSAVSKIYIEKRQRSLSLSSAVAKPKRKRKPQMEQWDRHLFGRRRRTQSLSSDLDKKSGAVDTDELLTSSSRDLLTRSKTAQLHSTSNGIVSVRPSLSGLKQLDEHNSLTDKVLTECLTNGTSDLKSATKTSRKKPIESDYIPQFFDVVWAKCKGFKPYPALVRLLLIYSLFES